MFSITKHKKRAVLHLYLWISVSFPQAYTCVPRFFCYIAGLFGCEICNVTVFVTSQVHKVRINIQILYIYLYYLLFLLLLLFLYTLKSVLGDF